MFDTKPYEIKMNQAVEHFQDELKKIRTGRAHSAMLDSVQVEVYGTKLPLNQTANITAGDPQVLQVTPFDPANIQAINEAIRAENSLGFNPSDDGRVVRVPVPPLTQERRQLVAKHLKEKVEACRIAIRTIRQDALKTAKAMKNDSTIGADDFTRIEKELDRLGGELQSRIDTVAGDKEKDILTI